MNISRLIEKLQAIQNEHGDLPVGVDDYNSGYGGAGEPYLEVCGRRMKDVREVQTIVEINSGEIRWW